MRLRVSDAATTLALLEHLELQGFPAAFVTSDELDVLFPGNPGRPVTIAGIGPGWKGER